MNKLEKYKEKLESIMKENKNKKLLSELLSDMAFEFDIPLFPSEEFKVANKEMMQLFDEITGAIFTTHNVRR